MLLYTYRMELICPKCKKPLHKENKSLICPMRHCYDVSQKGYVNLLIHKSSVNPGDNVDMVVARKTVMQNGYYSALIEKVSELVKGFAPTSLLDLGCGEGSLTARLSEIVPDTIGMDISKSAINKACSYDKKTRYIVGSITDIPIANDSVDLLVNCFAPIVPDEARRVLKKDGLLLKITPSEKHLFELKQAIYPNPYLNERKDCIDGFFEKEEIIVESKVSLSGDYLLSVIKMTPYFYKTPKEYLKKVENETIETTLQFRISILKKIS